MGGLVIAKAVTSADSHRKEFPLVFEAISAAIFFGTPFKGAAAAPVASMYANIAEKLGQAKSSELLEFSKILPSPVLRITFHPCVKRAAWSLSFSRVGSSSLY